MAPKKNSQLKENIVVDKPDFEFFFVSEAASKTDNAKVHSQVCSVVQAHANKMGAMTCVKASKGDGDMCSRCNR